MTVFACYKKTFAALCGVFGVLTMYVSCRQVQIEALRNRKTLDDLFIAMPSTPPCDNRSELENIVEIRQEQIEVLSHENLQRTPEKGEKVFRVLSDYFSDTGSSHSPNHASAINNQMDRELEAADIPADFGERMASLFRDKNEDEMVRNFAVQHLERFAQERTIRGTWDVDSDEAAKVRAALEDAALEVDNSIGGTAMLALARLSEIDPHVDRRRLSSRSASLVANPSARLSTRIAAAQLCGLLRVRSALSTLRSLASDSATPTPLRLSADRAVTEIESR